MNLSPEDRDKVCRMAAAGIVAEIRKGIDLAELVTLPLDAVGQMVGLQPARVRRVMATREMGPRKLGVSLKEVQKYLSQTKR